MTRYYIPEHLRPLEKIQTGLTNKDWQGNLKKILEISQLMKEMNNLKKRVILPKDIQEQQKNRQNLRSK